MQGSDTFAAVGCGGGGGGCTQGVGLLVEHVGQRAGLSPHLGRRGRRDVLRWHTMAALVSRLHTGSDRVLRRLTCVLLTTLCRDGEGEGTGVMGTGTRSPSIMVRTFSGMSVASLHWSCQLLSFDVRMFRACPEAPRQHRRYLKEKLELFKKIKVHDKDAHRYGNTRHSEKDSEDCVFWNQVYLG